MAMIVSIIVPVLNEVARIEMALQRLIGLEGDFEILVVDGGSADDTVGKARPYATVLIGERGRAKQMNLGASRARGDVLLFVHADTSLPPDALHRVETALSDPAVVGGRFMVRLDSPRLVFRVVEAGINLRDRLVGGFTGDQAIFIRARTFRQLGGYSAIPLMEDLDLGARMRRLGRTARLPVAATTSARRWEKNGICRTILVMWCLRYSYLLGVSPTFLTRFYGHTR
ncbi:MAG: TIGR04283 family arsenosugar biosynthesis glycosyltransferase [Chloroflexi bacterium]|nr:TIGR04283 family arsenosugar biosynthesis glycosyltransferase [Chloroflexota bacterium]